MKKLLFAFVLCFLASCAAGPEFLAKTENEGVRTSYQDPKLDELATQNQEKLKDIYYRYQLAKIDVYPQGIGFVTLSDDRGKKHYYLLVDVRPRDIKFGMGQTTSQERFSEVIGRHFEKNLRLVGEGDMGMKGIEGLAFAVHWPVRDLSQCDSHGGFLEYAMVYFPKARFVSLKQGKTTFSDVLKDAEVITSLDMKDPTAVRVVQGR
jgi:hypothetical protein